MGSMGTCPHLHLADALTLSHSVEAHYVHHIHKACQNLISKCSAGPGVIEKTNLVITDNALKSYLGPNIFGVVFDFLHSHVLRKYLLT